MTAAHKRLSGHRAPARTRPGQRNPATIDVQHATHLSGSGALSLPRAYCTFRANLLGYLGFDAVLQDVWALVRRHCVH